MVMLLMFAVIIFILALPVLLAMSILGDSPHSGSSSDVCTSHYPGHEVWTNAGVYYPTCSRCGKR